MFFAGIVHRLHNESSPFIFDHNLILRDIDILLALSNDLRNALHCSQRFLLLSGKFMEIFNGCNVLLILELVSIGWTSIDH
jgi:hypothetical protein